MLHHPLSSRGGSASTRSLVPLSIPASSSHDSQHLSPIVAALHSFSAVAASQPISSDQLAAPPLLRRTPVSAARVPLPPNPRVWWARLISREPASKPGVELSEQQQCSPGQEYFNIKTSTLTRACELLRDLQISPTDEGGSRSASLEGIIGSTLSVLDFSSRQQNASQRESAKTTTLPVTGKRKFQDEDANLLVSHRVDASLSSASSSPATCEIPNSEPCSLWVFRILADGKEAGGHSLIWSSAKNTDSSERARREQAAEENDVKQALSALQIVESGDYLLSDLFGDANSPRCGSACVSTQPHAWLQQAVEQRAADIFVARRTAKIERTFQDRTDGLITKTPAAVSLPMSPPPQVSSDAEEGEVVESKPDDSSLHQLAEEVPSVLDTNKHPLLSAGRFGPGVLLLPSVQRPLSLSNRRKIGLSRQHYTVYITFRAHMSTEALLLQSLPTKQALTPLSIMSPEADELVEGQVLRIAPSGQEVRFLMRAGDAGLTDDDLRLELGDLVTGSDDQFWLRLSEALLVRLRAAGHDKQSLARLTANDWVICAPLHTSQKVSDMPPSSTTSKISASRQSSVQVDIDGHERRDVDDKDDEEQEEVQLPESSFLWPAHLCFFDSPSSQQYLPLSSASSLPSRLRKPLSSSVNGKDSPRTEGHLPGLHHLPLQDLTQRTAELLHKLTVTPASANAHPSGITALTPASVALTPKRVVALESAPLDEPGVYGSGDPETLAAAEVETVNDEGDDDDDLWGGSQLDDSHAERDVTLPTAALHAASLPQGEDETALIVPDLFAPVQEIQSPLADDEDDFAGLVTENDFDFFDDDNFDVLANMDVEMGHQNDTTGGDDGLGGLLDTVEEIPMGPPDAVSGPTSTSGQFPFSGIVPQSATQPISSDSGPSIDPPSLPGFTPSSLTASASSPLAHTNGYNFAKTPRTPFSPYEDNALEPMIAGDDPRLLHGGMVDQRYGDHSAFQTRSGVSRGAVSDVLLRDDVSKPFQKSDTLPLYPSLDIGSKYDLGKFAMPLGREDSASLLGVGGRTSRGSRGRQIVASGLDPSLPKLHNLRLQGERTGHQHGKTASSAMDETESEGSHYGDDNDSDCESEDQSEVDDMAALKDLIVRNACALLSTSTFVPGQPLLPLHSQPAKPAFVARGNVAHRQRWMDIQISSVVRDPSLHHQRRDKLSNQPHKILSALEIVDVVSGLRDMTALPEALSTTSATCLIDNLLASSAASSPERLDPPLIMVGCQETVVRIASSALHFWDKLALSPIGGPKIVTAFVMHPPLTMSWNAVLKGWQGRLQAAFELYGLGAHKLHVNGMLEIDCGGQENVDLFPTLEALSHDADRWSDTLRSVADRLRDSLSIDQHVVLYILGDPTLSQPLLHRLQTDLRALTRTVSGPSGDHLLVQAISLSSTTEASDLSLSTVFQSANHFGRTALTYHKLRRFVFNLYNNLSRVILRQNLRLLQEDPRPKALSIQYPAFTLAPPSPEHSDKAADFELYKVPISSLPSLSVVHRGMLLHVAYKLSDKGVFVSAIDMCGQASSVQSFPRQKALPQDLLLVSGVARDMARRANILWRVIICKIGAISAIELEAWNRLAATDELKRFPSLDVTLMCTDIEMSLAVLPTRLGHPSGTSAAPETIVSTTTAGQLSASKQSVLVNSSTASYALYPRDRMACNGPIAQREIHDPPSQPLLALCTSMIICVPRHTDLSFVPPGHDSTGATLAYAHASHVLGLHMLQVWETRSMGSRLARPKAGGSAVDKDEHIGASSSSPSHAERLRVITRSVAALRLLTTERAGISIETHGVAARLPWHLAILMIAEDVVKV